jgi:hypothetical protein
MVPRFWRDQRGFITGSDILIDEGLATSYSIGDLPPK